MITAYQAQYYAYDLTKRGPADSVEKLAGTLLDAQVDLNPHQVEAALFAFKSPLSNGAILADEVGLGKTIEAGLVISQKWAERKRKILIITPASLRKQWNQELLDKFFLPSMILEAKSYNALKKSGKANPFEQKDIVICSYNFAAGKADDLKKIGWDLIIVDEAHRLRNVYKSGNVTARKLKGALENYPKVLLTATPLQNSLMELYGLVSFIDEYAFGDAKSFRAQYARVTNEETFLQLKSRLKPICHRTLRRQVLEYIKYTNRLPYTQEFYPSEEEQTLYDEVSEYLRRPNLKALPPSQRKLMTLVMRKLLASSTFAIAGALDSLTNKLKRELKDDQARKTDLEEIAEDFETLEELGEEINEALNEDSDPEQLLGPAELQAIQAEIRDLEKFRDLAISISENAKGMALLEAMNVGFEKAQSLGAMRKAIIFTESKRTQNYLVDLLAKNGFEGKTVLFNGSNTDDQSKAIYTAWLEKNKNSDRVSGSRTADMRSALVDFFRNEAEIMIATEAGAEGINLQFCSLLVNYDLPWNPQRIEQRIGRCHRYGQKHDVVVINFLNRKNEADVRVYELLSEKFSLFSGVFGASDDVLGAIESGVDFEQQVADIYQNCRTPEQISFQFGELQKQLEGQIDEAMKSTRKNLLENFDAEVHDKLKINLQESQDYLGKFEQRLYALAKFELSDYAEFGEKNSSFTLKSNPFPDLSVPNGPYKIGKNIDDAHIFRIQHPLAQRILQNARNRQLGNAELVFDLTGSGQKIHILNDLKGKSGFLKMSYLTIESAEDEDFILTSAITEEGRVLGIDQIARMIALPAQTNEVGVDAGQAQMEALEKGLKAQEREILEQVSTRNSSFFDEEMEKLDLWAEDKRVSLKTQLGELDDQIKDLKKQVKASTHLPDKIAMQKELQKLQSKRDTAWKDYDEASREIEKQKDGLIDRVESRLAQNITRKDLYMISWRVI